MGRTNPLGLIVRAENMFKEQDYGNPITERLSETLRRNLTKDDFANVAIRSKVSFSTIRDVVYRTNSLTKTNANAICLLIYAAFENSIAYKLRSETDMMYLEKLLNV